MMRGKEKEVVETRFTPGPWHCSSTMLGKAYGVGAEDNDNICHIIGPHENGSENFKADAYLIAAAPELYAALSSIVDALEIECELFDDAEDKSRLAIARATLAKARGES